MFLAAIIYYVNRIANAPISLKSRLRMTIQREIKSGMGLSGIDHAIIQLERIARLVSIGAMSAPCIDRLSFYKAAM